jgi:hypothetical protein
MCKFKISFIFLLFWFGVNQLPAQNFVALPEMNDERNGHVMVELTNGAILVAGGFNSGEGANLSSAEILEDYQSAEAEWDYVADMAVARYTASAHPLPNNKAIVIGGWDGGSNNWNTTEIFDFEEMAFSAGPNMNLGRSDHASVKLSDGRILVCGGFTGLVNSNTAEIYDPVANSFTQIANMNFGRSQHTATLLNDGKVLVVGGYLPVFALGFQISKTEVYDPVEDTWTLLPDLNKGRDNHAAILIPNTDKVLITGGREFTGSQFIGIQEAEIFDPADNSFTQIDDMVSGHSFHQMFVYENYIVIPGSAVATGVDVPLSFSPTTFFDPESDSWFTLPEFDDVDGRLQYAGTSITSNGSYDVIISGGSANFGSVDLYVNTLVGLKLIEQTNDWFTPYPNPINSHFSVKAKGAKQFNFVKLYNAKGKLVKSFQGFDNQFFDVSDLEGGFYIADLLDVNQNTVGRLKLIIN